MINLRKQNLRKHPFSSGKGDEKEILVTCIIICYYNYYLMTLEKIKRREQGVKKPNDCIAHCLL